MAGDDTGYYMRPGHVIAAAVVLSVVDIVAVALRFWARKIQRQPPKTDDWLMVPATLVTVCIGISDVYAVSQRALAYPIEVPPGFTGNTSELATPQLSLKSKIEWAYLLMFPIALACMKTSFLFFYARVFAVQKHGLLNKLLTGFIVFVVLWAVAFFFSVLFECGSDFRRIWSSSSEEFMSRCSRTVDIVLALCITDFVTDIFIFLIPIPLVLQLKLSTSRKLSVCLMFLLGGVTVAVSILRFIMMVGTSKGDFGVNLDPILDVTGCMYWGMVECGVGVFAACLPTIQFLFRKFIWEPASISTKSMFYTRSSRSSESRKDSVYVDRTFNIAYDKVNSDSSRAASPGYLSSVASEGHLNRSYNVWDNRVGPAV
ncbi:hypothetical protein F5Y05DRAFT_167348 [Hypoxylon sp. FL0543]|nr:hypothetical protein F5Y05DRAFT_167348 [Hypoxylon sp. FL0543]